jgi:hypothetical protein
MNEVGLSSKFKRVRKRLIVNLVKKVVKTLKLLFVCFMNFWKMLKCSRDFRKIFKRNFNKK